MHKTTVVLATMLATSTALADGPTAAKAALAAPAKLVGTYWRTPGEDPHDFTADKEQ